MNYRPLGALLLVPLLFLQVGAHSFPAAQAVPSKVEPLRFDRAAFNLNVQSSGAILQDRDGFLWIGTDGAGLARFDGYELKTYKPGGVNPFPDAYVYALYEDREGLIWIGTGTGGLVRYDKSTDSFTQYKHDPQNPRSLSSDISTIFAMGTIQEDADGLLWIGTQEGLNAFDKRAGIFTRYLHDPVNPNSLSNNDVHAVLVDREGRIWIGTNGGGLDRLDKATGLFTHYTHDPADLQSLASDVVYTLLEDQEGTLWVGTDHGFHRLNPAAGSFARYPHDPVNANSPTNDAILSLYQDGAGTIWITYLHNPQGGLTAFDPRSSTFLNHLSDPGDPYSLSSNYVESVLEDRSGILWIVHITGEVDKLDKNASRFRLYPSSPLPHPMTSQLYEDSRRTLWISSFPAGLTSYDKNTATFTPRFDDFHYSAICEDATGDFWLATTLPTALHLYDRETGKIVKSFSHDPASPASMSADNMQIGAIVEDKFDPNLLWLSAYGAGVEQFNKQTETFKHFAHGPNNPNTISTNSLWTLDIDREGIVWLPTTGGGLDRLDPRTGIFTHYTHDPLNPSSLSSNSTNVVFEDSTGRLWVGTELGFDKLDRATGKFTHYTQATHYPVTVIASILEDSAGNLWMGSYGGDGLIKFDPRTEIMTVFRQGDGLPSNTFTFGAVKDFAGELWFATTNGVVSFYPDEVGANTYVPPVKVTAFKQGGEAMPLGRAPERANALTLDWQHNYFEFEYVALNFTNPAENKYKYMLEGLDKGWYEAGTRRFGRYSHLPGGNYTLRLLASNNDGVWNEQGATVKIHVASPWWKAWWFYPLVGALLCGGLLLAYLYRSHQVRTIGATAQALRESEEQYRQLTFILEQRVLERTSQLDATNEALTATNEKIDSINQELVATNQELEAFDYSVSHDLRAPLRRLESFSQILLEEHSAQLDESGKKLLQRLRSNAQRMSELIDDLLGLSQVTRGAFKRLEVNLSAAVQLIADELRQQEPARQVEFVIAEDVVAYADPHLVRVALENLLGNAWKFTSQTAQARIEFGTTQEADAPLVYFVRDNGVGLDMAKASNLFRPFQRLAGAEGIPGHGIGLATVKRIIQRHSGRIWVQGAISQGATFYFTIPHRP